MENMENIFISTFFNILLGFILGVLCGCQTIEQPSWDSPIFQNPKWEDFNPPKWDIRPIYYDVIYVDIAIV